MWIIVCKMDEWLLTGTGVAPYLIPFDGKSDLHIADMMNGSIEMSEVSAE